MMRVFQTLFIVLASVYTTLAANPLGVGSKTHLTFAPKKDYLQNRLHHDTTTIAVEPGSSNKQDHSTVSLILSSLRGGACDDTNAALFGKVGLSAALQTAGLMGVLAIGQSVSTQLSKIEKLPKFVRGEISGIPIAQMISFVFIIFSSSVVGSLVDGATSAAFNQAFNPNVNPNADWYANVIKPSWNPPGWVFPIMWLIVSKPTQLAAVSKLWKAVDGADRGWRLLAYTFHLSLGDAWNKVFFGYQCIGRGTVVITAFISMLFLSTALFWSVDPMAGKLMLPTCGWVSIATALQWSIYFLNR